MENEPEKIEIVAQLTGFKSLSAGGWRLSMDLFDSKIKDILSVAALVNVTETVKIIIAPMEEK